MTITGIQWIDDLAAQRFATPETWNPIRGCRRASRGCYNCYAEAIAKRFSAPGQPFEGLIDPRTGKWNGETRLIEARLNAPLDWRKPRDVFVNSAFDLFQAGISSEWIARIFAIMAQRPDCRFLILTKEPDRMREWVKLNAATPLPNVWLGVSVEDQESADNRIPALLDTPAALHFVSCEPLIGPVDLVSIGAQMDRFGIGDNALAGGDFHHRLAWVIVGGESGTHARPLHPHWRERILTACAEHGVAAYDKQPGEWAETEVWTNTTWPIRVDGDTGECRSLRGDHPRCNDVVMSRVGHKQAAVIHPPTRRELPPYVEPERQP